MTIDNGLNGYYIGAIGCANICSHGFMSTIREVAQKAGVSFTTVSHVLNDTRDVSPETRQKVLDAMRLLDCRPNVLVRSLRLGALVHAATMGLRLPDDLSVVGFDAIDLAAYNKPSHTTYAQPRPQIA